LRIPVGRSTASISLFCLAACRAGHHEYRVVPQTPVYLLRYPDSHEVPLADVLRDYNGFERGRASIDLRPKMQIRIENAYYEKGFSRKGLKGYLGTEVARYEVGHQGLHLLSFVPMKARPENDLPVQNLISAAQLRFPYYRLYFEILFNRKTDSHGSLLLAAESIAALDRLSGQLSDPEKLCRDSPGQCAIFPEACSVSVEMSIVVNQKTRLVNWGSLLSSVVNHPPQQLEVQRLYRGHLTPVKFDLNDPNELGLPLLPDDHVTWR
jgi:hypothetical protein